MNIRLGFAANSRVLIVLFPTNEMPVVTKIIIEKRCDKALLRSHMLTVLSPLKTKLIHSVSLYLSFMAKLKAFKCYIAVQKRSTSVANKITPVHKSGDKTSVTNYHPISLLCIISKVLERVMYYKIIDLVATSLTPLQFSFQRRLSTLQRNCSCIFISL